MTSELDGKSVSDAVGEGLRRIRKRRGLTVEQLAELCAAGGADELTANSLYSIENGRRKAGERTRRITVDELFALAKVLDVSPLELAGQPAQLPAALEKLLFDLTLAQAASGGTDYGELVIRVLNSALLTSEHAQTVESVHTALRPRREQARAEEQAASREGFGNK